MKVLITALGLLNFIILTGISALHLYWAFGGKVGMGRVLPTDEFGKRLLNPGKIDCAVVSIFLFVFGLIFLLNVFVFTSAVPTYIFKYGSWTISFIFLLRAVGDFKYVGFSKQIKSTEFATMDSLYFSPLCFGLAVSGLIISIYQF